MSEILFSGKQTCKGRAFICAYNFSTAFVKTDGFVPSYLKGKYDGGFGAVIFADYTESPVGPYQEVLFIPGKFDVEGETRYVATKCYVSKPEAINEYGDGFFGRKELGIFHMTMVSDNTMHLSVHKGRNRVITVEIGVWNSFSIPGSSNIINFPFMQLLKGDERLLWQYDASCDMNLARLASIQVRPAFFPDVATCSPIVTLGVNNFTLNFEPEQAKE